MRLRFTFLLLALNVVVFAAIAILNHMATQSNATAQPTPILAADSLSNLSAISLTATRDADPATFKLVRATDGSWSLAAPFVWEANPFAVRSLLHELNNLTPRSTFTTDDARRADISLAQYSLDPPTLQIALERDSLPPINLALGVPDASARLYLRGPDPKSIHVLEPNAVIALASQLSNLRNNSIFHSQRADIQSVQIQDRLNATARVRIVYQPASRQWRFNAPIDTAADPVAVEALINGWLDFQVTRFRPDLTQSANFDDPAIRLSFESANGRESVLLNAPNPENPSVVLARRENTPVPFEVPAALFQRLTTAQADLRQKRVLADLPPNWNTLEIRVDANVTTLQQLENGLWQVIFTDEQQALRSLPADAAIIDNLRNIFPDLTATRFVSDAPADADLLDFGLLDPQRVLTFRFPDHPPVSLRIGGIAPSESLFYATTSQSQSVFLIRPFLLSQLPLNPLHYRDRTLYTLGPAVALTNIQLQHLPTQSNLLAQSPNPDVLGALQAFFRQSRFKDFVQEDFSNPLILDPQTPIPFLFELSADIRLPGNESTPTVQRSFLLSAPIGDNTLFIADPASRMVGIAPESLANAIIPLLAPF